MKDENPNYLVLCLVCYYCLVRRTELTKLKVRDVILKNSVIYIDSSISKNKKSAAVTIPDKLVPYMVEHLKTANLSDYLFSTDFIPGDKQLAPKKISDEWVKIRNALNLKDKYQWYSLKDTGITNLLRSGISLIAARDQARHHSSMQTDAYTPKELIKANEDIRIANI